MKKTFTVKLTLNVTKLLEAIGIWVTIFILGFICFFALCFLDAKNSGTLDAMADYLIQMPALTSAAIASIITLEQYVIELIDRKD